MLLREHTELSINPRCPLGDLVIDDVDPFKPILKLCIIILNIAQITVHLDYLCVLAVSTTPDALTGIDLQVMESFAELLVISLEHIHPTFMVRDCGKELSVCLLTLLESKHHGLDISHTSCCLNLLKSIVDLLRGSHLLFHFLSHEVVPKLINVKMVAHFQLRGVLAFIGCCLSYLLVLSLPLDSTTH